MKRVILFVLILGAALGLWFGLSFLSGNGLESRQAFIIKPGQGVNEISRNLDQQGIIKSKLVFETWVWFRRVEHRLQAGVYNLPPDISIRELIHIFIIGPDNSQRSITFLEGWHRGLDKFGEALTGAGLSYEKFLDLTKSKKDWEDTYDFLADAPAGASLEGYLFPNTHFIDAETTEEELLRKILNDFDRQLSPALRQEIAAQGKTIFEVITLASIIEREVPQAADKKMIADIFLKRLDENIGLQSDATINFVTGRGLTQPTLDDLKVESPYNTYKYRGLPPGPIGNPGLASIEAVIYPTANNYFYFLTTPEGQVIYSRNYDEHLANKAKYLP